MNNKECDDLKKIGKELWEIYNTTALSKLETLKTKIQELNEYLSSYGGD